MAHTVWRFRPGHKSVAASPLLPVRVGGAGATSCRRRATQMRGTWNILLPLTGSLIAAILKAGAESAALRTGPPGRADGVRACPPGRAMRIRLWL